MKYELGKGTEKSVLFFAISDENTVLVQVFDDGASIVKFQKCM